MISSNVPICFQHHPFGDAIRLGICHRLILIAELDNVIAQTMPPHRSAPITGTSTLLSAALELIFHIGILPRSISPLVISLHIRRSEFPRSVIKAMNRARAAYPPVAAGSTCRIVSQLVPQPIHNRGFDNIIWIFDGSSDGSLSFTFSALTCRSIRPTFRQSLTTGAFLRPSSTAWFGACDCPPAPRGPPSSLITATESHLLLTFVSRHTEWHPAQGTLRALAHAPVEP